MFVLHGSTACRLPEVSSLSCYHAWFDRLPACLETLLCYYFSYISMCRHSCTSVWNTLQLLKGQRKALYASLPSTHCTVSWYTRENSKIFSILQHRQSSSSNMFACSLSLEDLLQISACINVELWAWLLPCNSDVRCQYVNIIMLFDSLVFSINYPEICDKRFFFSLSLSLW